MTENESSRYGDCFTKKSIEKSAHLHKHHYRIHILAESDEKDESRFNISSDDIRIRLWRLRGEHLSPAFDLQQHTSPTADVMVWCDIAYNTQSTLSLIRGTMTAQLCVHNIV
ncbi:transposable element Tcb1 transposase [Trichonephila clavipes]|nr:transposable element Tcb1 transposase [Trichonephila clavipes]